MDEKFGRVLVELAHGRASAAVTRRVDGRVWLVVDREIGCVLDGPDGRGIIGLSHGAVMGGVLPPGAVAAEVVDDDGSRVAAAVRDGAWIAMLAHPARGEEPPVVFRDPGGAPVATELPPRWDRVPVTDAISDCVACGQRAWDEVASVGSVVCRACGRTEGAPVPAETEGAPLSAEARQRVLEQASVPVFVLAGVEMLVARWGASAEDRVPDSVRMRTADGRLTVTSAARPVPVAAELRAHVAADHRAELPDISLAALVPWAAARRRDVHEAVATARRSVIEIPVDGVPQHFELWTAGGAWVASHRGPDAVLIVGGHGPGGPGAIALVRRWR